MTNKQAALVEYSKEIGPLSREIEKKKELIKDFKESDERALELKEDVKAAQEAYKAYVEGSDRFKEINAELKDLQIELDEAVKAAARATKDTDRPLKAGELKPYFVARNKPVDMGKPTPVAKVINKGDIFDYLEDQLKHGDV